MNFERHDDAGEIEPMFEIVRERATGGFKDWVDSVYDYWLDRGYLTGRQFEVLRQAVERHNG